MKRLLSLLFLYVFAGMSPYSATAALPNASLLKGAQACSLLQAVSKKDVAQVKRLLNAHANPDCTDKNGVTPLQKASYIGSYPIVALLLQHQADVTMATLSNQELPLGTYLTDTKAGSNALMLACFAGNSAIVRALLEAHAPINAIDSIGQNALVYVLLGYALWAREPLPQARKDIVEMLLDAGINPLKVDANGLTPAYYYARAVGTDAVESDDLYKRMK